MTTARLARYDAINQEEIVAQWRDWCAYLRAELTLLDARLAEGRLAFERAESLQDAAQQAQAALAAIGAARRAVFRAVHEAQRQQALAEREAAPTAQAIGTPRPTLDPDLVDREVLTALLAAATGENTVDGRGLVPMEAQAASDMRGWYSLDVQALADAPSAAAYDVRTQEALARRSRILAMLGLLTGGALIMVIWALWPSRARPIASTTELRPMRNGVAVASWPLQTLVLTATNGENWTLPISTTQGAWPAAPAERTAYWRTPALLPLTLCVPALALSHLAGVELIGGDLVPDRIYALRETAAGSIDLIVESCTRTNSGSLPRRYGQLQALRPIAGYAVGDAAPLRDGALGVMALEVVGPGEDPLLPPGQAWVLVRVASAAARDWPALNPTLLLADGQALLPGETTAVNGGVELRYLIPLPRSPGGGAWSVTLPDQPHPLRWRTILPPPPDRDTVLRKRLDVRALTVERTADGTLLAHLTLRNIGTTPLQLAPADLTLSQGGQRLGVVDVAALHAAIGAGATQIIQLPLPAVGQTPLLLRIGAQQFQIALERR